MSYLQFYSILVLNLKLRNNKNKCLVYLLKDFINLSSTITALKTFFVKKFSVL